MHKVTITTLATLAATALAVGTAQAATPAAGVDLIEHKPAVTGDTEKRTQVASNSSSNTSSNSSSNTSSNSSSNTSSNSSSNTSSNSSSNTSSNSSSNRSR